jgi:hypothetical protein
MRRYDGKGTFTQVGNLKASTSGWVPGTRNRARLPSSRRQDEGDWRTNCTAGLSLRRSSVLPPIFASAEWGDIFSRVPGGMGSYRRIEAKFAESLG